MVPIRVLIVDDEELIRNGIARLVEQAGMSFQVIGTCSSAKEALISLEITEIDFIITDIRMPEMDGLELLTEVKRIRPHVFSMVISGYEEFEYARSALKLGASDYILKPIDRKQFREQLHNMMELVTTYRRKQFLQQDLDDKSQKLVDSQLGNFLNSVLYASRPPHRQEWQGILNPLCRYRLIATSIDRVQRIDSYSIRDYELFEYARNGIIRDICGEFEGSAASAIALHSWNGLDGWGWILVNTIKQDEQESDMDTDETSSSEINLICEELTAKLQEAFRQYIPVSVSLGVSNVLEDISTIGQAAAEARASLQRRLFEGGGKCHWLEKQPNDSSVHLQESKSTALRLSELESKLFSVVRLFDEAVIRTIVDDLFAVWKKNALFSGDLPAIVLSLMLRATILIDEIRLEDRDTGKLMSTSYIENTWRKMQVSSDVLELKEELLHFLLLIAGKLKSLRFLSEREPVEKAKAYIEQHLADELTLSVVAGEIYLNPSYFSNLFKIQTGENFLNYVTRIRMEKARELLKDRVLKLNEIANKVGYQNPKYFTKLFKEHFGSTPTDYRENQLK
ncbi:response regulator transcription factor [Paenibacillus planticolens]|uniref:response regulator transcription factor n=1 Tax=Paenibacillus planticolens TaxID=2654976 RepID=UPI0014927FC2|nr:response regulator [Paenibacillus planticolens]